MPDKEAFSFLKFIKGVVNPITHAKTVSFILVVVIWIVLGSGAYAIFRHFFPSKKQTTSTTSVGHVEAGGVSNITNINNAIPDLHQGIYAKVASDRATIGVFKEVMPNVDISIGAGKDYDSDFVAEVETRFKF